jgi:hypothetical protein
MLSEMINMLRSTACAAVGIVLACGASYSLSLQAQPEVLSFDERWSQGSDLKQDRLDLATPTGPGQATLTFDLPAHGMSVVVKRAQPPMMESAVRALRPTSVRTIPVSPVRELPNEEVKRQRLPVGCEPAFSPVTTPAYAHIGVRCDS